MTNKELLLEVLKSIENGTNRNPRDGICGNVERTQAGRGQELPFFYTWKDLYRAHIDNWPHFSGNQTFPIPDPLQEVQSGTIFMNTGDMWEGGYGVLRFDLLRFLIKALEKEIENEK